MSKLNKNAQESSGTLEKSLESMNDDEIKILSKHLFGNLHVLDNEKVYSQPTLAEWQAGKDNEGKMPWIEVPKNSNEYKVFMELARRLDKAHTENQQTTPPSSPTSTAPAQEATPSTPSTLSTPSTPTTSTPTTSTPSSTTTPSASPTTTTSSSTPTTSTATSLTSSTSTTTTPSAPAELDQANFMERFVSALFIRWLMKQLDLISV